LGPFPPAASFPEQAVEVYTSLARRSYAGSASSNEPSYSGQPLPDAVFAVAAVAVAGSARMLSQAARRVRGKKPMMKFEEVRDRISQVAKTLDTLLKDEETHVSKKKQSDR
jgi:hypothetical protein